VRDELHSNKFLTSRDGAVLPILHLNGYKIAVRPCWRVFPKKSCDRSSRLRHETFFVEGNDPRKCTRRCRDARPRWPTGSLHSGDARATASGSAALPMIVSPYAEGVDRAESRRRPAGRGSFRSHQVPVAKPAPNPSTSASSREWMRSYRPEELFDEAQFRAELASLAPEGDLRMG